MRMKDFDENKVLDIIFGIGIDHSNRMSIFMNRAHELTDKEFWFGFRNAYDSSDNLLHSKDEILFFIGCNIGRVHKEYLMNQYERRYFKKLPSTLVLYRGMTIQEYESGEFGMSWTLSKKVAEYFAYTYKRNHATANSHKMVCNKVINKDVLLCYLSERKEREILIWWNGFE